VQRGSEAFAVAAEVPSTAALLGEGLAAVRATGSAGAGGVPVDRLVLRSPVTTPCRVVAQAVNYRAHAQESGFGERPPAVFFRKSSASVSGVYAYTAAQALVDSLGGAKDLRRGRAAARASSSPAPAPPPHRQGRSPECERELQRRD
jgi:2-keto-4-pentenoate hydratase/2-oxohepta-3-ene-1,7-dioic acid hydratase in catechol pathway